MGLNKCTNSRRSKGSVEIQNNNGSIRLRWRVNGQRYTLSPGLKHDELGLKAAARIASQIELDILSNNFSGETEKYKPNVDAKPPEKLKEEKPKFVYALDLYRAFLAASSIKERTYYAHYHPVLRMLEKVNPKLESLASWIQKEEKLAPKTWNDRLYYLKRSIIWALKAELIDSDLGLGEVENRPIPRNVKPERKPFTSKEVRAIIEALKTDQFKSEHTPWKHSHYYPYFAFQLYTGCRPAEVIGLQWKHVDFERKEVEISTVLARGDKGQTSSKHRVRKETKNGMVRLLPMDDELFELLSSLYQKQGKEELVFPSPTGKAIDDKNIRDRVWKKVLEGLKIPYRVPYAGRHSMISRAIEQGVPLTGIAYLAGHVDTKMIHEHYGHMINRPSLPSL